MRFYGIYSNMRVIEHTVT